MQATPYMGFPPLNPSLKAVSRSGVHPETSDPGSTLRREIHALQDEVIESSIMPTNRDLGLILGPLPSFVQGCPGAVQILVQLSDNFRYVDLL